MRLILGCASSEAAAEAEPVDPSFDEFMSWLAEEADATDTPAVSVAIVVEGEVRHVRALGTTRRKGGADVTEETRFSVGSTTKMLTSAAVLSLVEEGKIDLDAPITTGVPSSVTMRQLLTHTSGMPDYLEVACEDTLSGWFAANTKPLWTPPGEVWNYSNLGYSLAGLVAEQAAGVPYEELMSARVFEPLGMGATFDTETVLAGEYAVGYTGTGPGTAFSPGDWDCSIAMPPGGQTWATAADLAAFAVWLIDAGWTAEVDTQLWPGLEYGFGVMSEEWRGERWVMHDGAASGFLTSVMTVPSRGFGVVVTANSYTATPGVWAEEAAARLLDLPDAEREWYADDGSAWPEYAGVYDEGYDLGEMEVTGEGTLTLTFHEHDDYATELVPFAGDTYYWNSGNGWLPGTFWRGAEGEVERFVTRAGVGSKRE